MRHRTSYPIASSGLNFDANQVGAAQVGAAQVGTAQVGTAQVRAQLRVAQVG
jgi:hypothetical protein